MTARKPSGLAALRTRITRERLVRYAGASGDFNPIHYSDGYARALGMPSVVAQGMLTMGVALQVVTRWCGDPARVVDYAFRFEEPLAVPDTPDGCELVVTGRLDDIGAEFAAVALEAKVGEAVVGRGSAKVRIDV